MRRYETTFILRPNLGETLFTEIIDRTSDIITDDGGAIIFLDRWGVKKLAYEIRKENHGYYIHFDFAAPATTVHEMERIFRLDDRVLRFLTIKTADAIDQETIEAESERVAAEATAVQEETAETEKSEAAPEEKANTEAVEEADAEEATDDKAEAVEEADAEDTVSEQEEDSVDDSAQSKE
jgi:small subunit ribosomal protein S6